MSEGGFPSNIKRLIKTITASKSRTEGGAYIDYVPYGIGALGGVVTLISWPSTATADVFKYGKIAAIAPAVATDCWLVGLQVSTPTQKDNAMYIAITRAAAGALLASSGAIEADVPVHVETAVEDFCSYIPIKPAVYFPQGTLINAACASEVVGATAGGNKIDVMCVIAVAK